MVNDADPSVDDEATQPEIGSAFDSAIRNLTRLLFDMKFECAAMDAALHTMDAVDLEIAANDIVCVWRAARDALKSVRRRAEVVRACERQADAAVAEHRQLLDRLFGRALVRTSGSVSHDRLAKLFAELSPFGDPAAEHHDRLLPVALTRDSGSSGAS